MINLPETPLPSDFLKRNQEIEQAEIENQIKRQALEEERKINFLKERAAKDPEALMALASIAPANAKAIVETQINQLNLQAQAGQAFLNRPLEERYKSWQPTLRALASRGVDVSELPAEYDPSLDGDIRQVIDQARAVNDQLGKREIIETSTGLFTTDPMTGKAQPIMGPSGQLQPFSKPSTQINIDPGETEESKKMGDLRVRRFEETLVSADKARNTIDILQTLKTAVEDPNASQGSFAAIRSESKKFADLFGIEVKSLKNDAILESVGNKLAIQLRNPKGDDGGLPGATSDRDLALLVAAVPSKNKTQSQNLALIEMGLKEKQRTVELGKYAVKYKTQNENLKGWELAKQEWLEANPLYPEGEEKERIKAMLKGQESPKTPSPANPSRPKWRRI